jgi:hypothetical protein
LLAKPLPLPARTDLPPMLDLPPPDQKPLPLPGSRDARMILSQSLFLEFDFVLSDFVVFIYLFIYFLFPILRYFFPVEMLVVCSFLQYLCFSLHCHFRLTRLSNF